MEVTEGRKVGKGRKAEDERCRKDGRKVSLTHGNDEGGEDIKGRKILKEGRYRKKERY
jgi:hypothetical protein